MNPTLKQDIGEGKIFNIKIYLGALAITLLLMLSYFDTDGTSTFKFAYGLVLAISTITFAQHVCTIGLFRFVRNNPDEMKGQITQSAKYSFTFNGWHHFESAIVIIPLAILSRSVYVYGALVGGTLLAVANILAYRKYKKDKKVAPNI
jgi:hypothetical protein